MADFTLTVYEADDVTPLFEVGTAKAHANPYLHMPGEFDVAEVDLLNGKALIGQINLRVIDPQTGATPVLAPDGATTADQLIEDGTAGSHSVFRVVTAASIADNSLVAWSIFAKANTRSIVALETRDKAGVVGATWFNLSTGTIGTTSAAHVARIEAFPNGWYRLSVRYSVGTGVTDPRFLLFMATADAQASYTGDGASSVYIWGAQAEVGNFASSYIATTSATLTRSAESLSFPNATWPSQEVTQYERYVDHATGALQETVATYTGTAPQALTLYRDFAAVLVLRGTRTLAECREVAA